MLWRSARRYWRAKGEIVNIEEIISEIESTAKVYRPQILMRPEAAEELVGSTELSLIGFIPVFSTIEDAQKVADWYSENSPEIEEFEAFQELP